MYWKACIRQKYQHSISIIISKVPCITTLHPPINLNILFWRQIGAAATMRSSKETTKQSMQPILFQCVECSGVFKILFIIELWSRDIKYKSCYIMYMLEPHWTWTWCSVANVSWEQFLYYTEPVRWVSIQREEKILIFSFLTL